MFNNNGYDPYYKKEHPSYSLARTGYFTETCVIGFIIYRLFIGFPPVVLGSLINELA